MRQAAAGVIIVLRWGNRLPRRCCIGLIRVYQRTARYRPPVCRFVPSCSEYTAQAVEKYGLVKGAAMGSWRLLRCNPFNQGGYDPVE